MSDIRQTATKDYKKAFCANLKKSARESAILNIILPVVKELVTDPNQHVKTELAGVTMGLASLVGKENTISQLLPIYMQLLKDSTAEVRLNFITNLHEVNDVIGASQLLNWRFICEYGAMHRDRDARDDH